MAWLAFGFHFLLQQAQFGRVLNQFTSDEQLRDLYRYAFQAIERIRIAWRSVLPKALFCFNDLRLAVRWGSMHGFDACP